MTASPARWSGPKRLIVKPESSAQFTEPPVVIGGCARSGTTLLISILSCHPRIYAIPHETQLLCIGTFDRAPSCKQPDLAQLYGILEHADVPASCRRWCEKTPRNALCFEQTERAIPGVRLISLVRDGRDVCTSRHPGNPADYWVDPGRWLATINAANKARNVYTIRYEDLILNYEPVVTNLLRWIGEDWHPALDDYPARATIRESRAWAHDAIPLHANGVGRWGKPEHRERLAYFNDYPDATDMLARLGYEMSTA